MDDYTIKLIEDGIFLLVYHTTVTEEVFRKAAEAQVEFAKTHIGGDYIIVVDYTEAMLKASALNFRLNSWAASVDAMIRPCSSPEPARQHAATRPPRHGQEL